TAAVALRPAERGVAHRRRERDAAHVEGGVGEARLECADPHRSGAVETAHKVACRKLDRPAEQRAVCRGPIGGIDGEPADAPAQIFQLEASVAGPRTLQAEVERNVREVAPRDADPWSEIRKP